MTIKSSQNLVEEALKEINTISPEDALKKFNDNKCNLIDIRDIRELQNSGKVENSIHIPRGMLEFWMDPNSAYFKEGKIDMDKELVLFCAGGLRSALGAKSLKDMGFEKVSHIDGEVMEIVAHGDKKTSKLVGNRISQLQLPKSIVIGAVVRDDNVILANEDIEIQDEDHIIIFAFDKKELPTIEKLFQVNVGFF